MNRATVTFHIGLPRTGTTVIQAYLQRHATCLEQYGIGVRSLSGGVAHHNLAHDLLCLDTRNRPPERSGTVDSPDCIAFPAFEHFSHSVVSAKDLCSLGPNGAMVLRDRCAGLRVAVVLALRPPVQWLWSCWLQQLRQGNTPTWKQLVEWHLRSHRLSSIFETWAPLASSGAIGVLQLSTENAELVTSFLERAEIPNHRCELAESPTTMDRSNHPLEHLYHGLLSRWVRYWVGVFENPSRPVPGAVIETALGELSASRPCFEISQVHRDRFDETQLGIYDTSTLDALRDYAVDWTNTIEACLSGRYGPIDRGSASSLVEHLRKCHAELYELRLDNPNPLRFPTEDFIERLPTDAGMQALSRSIAYLIVNQQGPGAMHVG